MAEGLHILVSSALQWLDGLGTCTTKGKRDWFSTCITKEKARKELNFATSDSESMDVYSPSLLSVFQLPFLC